MQSSRLINRWARHLVCALTLTALCACSGNGPTLVDGGGSYIPNFTFVWDEVNAAGAFIAPTHRFTLITDQAGSGSGTFNPQSSEEVGGARNVVTGTFKDRDLSLTVRRGTTNVPMTGKFLTDDTIELREPGRTYTVKRNTSL